METTEAVLLDIDGVLTVSWKPIPGAVDAFRQLRERGTRLLLLTNTTSRPRSAVVGALHEAGFEVEESEVLTAPALTAAYLAHHHRGARCMLLGSGDVRADLEGVNLVDDPTAAVDVVVLGGAGPEFSYEALNRAFDQVLAGAKLVAMHRNLFWRTADGMQLDTGAFLAGLERATDVEATVLGKPARAFFETALERLGAVPGEAVMVGDDIDADVLAAQACGITGVLVRTGKYLPGAESSRHGEADVVLNSVADFPDWLDRVRSGAVRTAR